MSDKKVNLKRKPFVLIIRDGWGYNPYPDQDSCNAVKLAETPVDDMLMSDYPHCLVETSGEAVGLPDGTMGNSEVGHQNMGAGRMVPQESVRLSLAIRDGSFFENEEFENCANFVKENKGKMHVMGLCSDIGVHSKLEHLYGLLEMAKKNGLEEVYIHAFTDGRDSPPTSGKGYLKDIQAKADEIGVGKIASITGRFYAMDRDSRWDRVQKAFEMLRLGKGHKTKDPQQAMQESYDNDITDEFVEPTVVVDDDNTALATIDDGDGVIFFNFRGDRPRELTRAFVEPEFTAFDRAVQPSVYFVCMTQYDASIPAPVAFKKPPKMKNILGSYISDLGLKQFRCAETEKYAHVTFFFNDYTEEPFEGEDRQIVPSPKVRTYDLKPEMSVNEVCGVILEKLDKNEYDVLVINYANPDMVGHTGDVDAAVKAAEAVDACVGKVLDKTKELGGAAIVTADHGNFEQMVDTDGGPHTAHTIGKVPLIIFDEERKNVTLRDGGSLADVAPTLLEMMEIEKPEEMTGQSLFVK